MHKRTIVLRHWGREHVFHSEDKCLGATSDFLICLYYGHKRIMSIISARKQLPIKFDFYKISWPKEISEVCCACNRVGEMVYILTHVIFHTTQGIFLSWIQLFNLSVLDIDTGPSCIQNEFNHFDWNDHFI